ncbi:hypothetical protein KPA07_06180 [Corynebacterium aurimucosum]|uniref:hypothetical protein n=1 Tax=Corynebacterium aurimucosum TaxID=169292 RepID=UPI001C0EFA75|nr:hypothetical protein [Corynebacterium aurimucosum]MBU5654499.1 hypothetical protein [Corynebacterium aurimucosum]
MINYLVTDPDSGLELPDRVKAGISIMAYDGWEFAQQAGEDAADVPTSIVGDVSIITEHAENFDKVDAVHVLAQALGVAIHDYKGCVIDQEEQQAILSECVKHIMHGIGIGHAMDEREG